jgi:hypothetical protein
MAKPDLKLPTTKTLSLHAPWAWAILHHGKNVENRSWATSYRGFLNLHHAKSAPYFDEDCQWLLDEYGIKVPPKSELHLGCILGSTYLYNCRYSEVDDGFWGQAGCYHWLLRGSWPLDEPIPVKGNRRIFDVQL